jgi:hypothetical protein
MVTQLASSAKTQLADTRKQVEALRSTLAYLTAPPGHLARTASAGQGEARGSGQAISLLDAAGQSDPELKCVSAVAASLSGDMASLLSTVRTMAQNLDDFSRLVASMAN